MRSGTMSKPTAIPPSPIIPVIYYYPWLTDVSVKISGLGMFDRNWTVDGMMSNYSRLWAAYSEIAVSFSENERNALFCTNAEMIYRI